MGCKSPSFTLLLSFLLVSVVLLSSIAASAQSSRVTVLFNKDRNTWLDLWSSKEEFKMIIDVHGIAGYDASTKILDQCSMNYTDVIFLGLLTQDFADIAYDSGLIVAKYWEYFDKHTFTFIKKTGEGFVHYNVYDPSLDQLTEKIASFATSTISSIRQVTADDNDI